tara:strand:- start:1766 stop:2623 length:858 start_codon:yes stop_codon:yes gene_type:complete
MGKKILVTGGAGFVGSAIVKRLLEDGHRVHSLDNYDSGLRENHHDGCSYYEGDIENILDFGKYDICYHMAALSRIQPSFNNPSETYRVNTTGTQNVCEWARKNNVKVIYAGSSSRWHNPMRSPYALAKHMGEEICKMYRKVYGLDVDIVRFYNVYGPGEIVDGDWAAVIGKWRRQVRDGEKITVVGDGEQKRDFTHIDDIVDGIIKITNAPNHTDAWELGTGKNYSINEVYLHFKARFGVEALYLPDQPGNYRETMRENDDALDALNWKPKDRLTNYIKGLKDEN